MLRPPTSGPTLAMLACLGLARCSSQAAPGAPSSQTAGPTTGSSTSATGGSAGTTGSSSVATGGPDGAATTGTGGAAGTGGSAGAAGSGGAGIDAGSSDGGSPGDTPPSRPIHVTATQARHEHTFRALAADPAVSFNDNDQIAVIDPRAAKLVGKLVLPFQGLGSRAGSLGASGEFCARRGFHVLAVAAFEDYDILLGDPDFYGDARKQVFDGLKHTSTGAFANITMGPADGVAQRVEKGLKYLHAMFPEEDWGYYLDADGTVRWSDVIFTGMSHGASNAPRFAMLVRAWRAVSFAGPRDNMCTSLDATNCGGVVAKWFDEVPATPIDRFYALTGTTDDQHTQHLFAMQKLGYVGQPVATTTGAPFGGSHRLVASGGGHQDFCGIASYAAACNYMFGVPPENAAGVP